MLFILGSRSPRRRELLESILGPDRLLIRPPGDSQETGFDSLNDAGQIEQRLCAIVDAKMQGVVGQVSKDAALAAQQCCIITADTIVVATDPAIGTVVLGQPDPEHWQVEVSDWMLRLYSETTHEVWTGFQIVCGDRQASSVVRTQVGFHQLTSDLVSRYLATGESPGKAGGYAIQGAAAAFVNRIDGSLTNVIGLPLMEVLQAMTTMGLRLPDVAQADGMK